MIVKLNHKLFICLRACIDSGIFLIELFSFVGLGLGFIYLFLRQGLLSSQGGLELTV